MIFRKTLRDECVKSLVFLILATGALGLAVFYYPTFAENRSFVARLVPIFVKGMIADVLSDDYRGYFLFQHFVKGLTFISPAAAIFIGMGAISKEVETGTAQILLSKPVGRTEVLLRKFAALALAVIVPVIGSSLLGIAMSRGIGERVPLGPTLAAAGLASLSAVTLLSATVLSSSIFDEQIKSGGYVGVLIVAEMALFLVDQTRSYSYFNLTGYWSYRKIYMDGRFPWREAAAMAAIGATCLGGAIAVFRRKDV